MAEAQVEQAHEELEVRQMLRVDERARNLWQKQPQNS
jgi:hypothetical protein